MELMWMYLLLYCSIACVCWSGSDHLSSVRSAEVGGEARRPVRSTEVTAEVVAAVGGDVVLDCDDPSGGRAELLWLHDGEPVSTSSGRRQLLRSSRLQISTLRVSDSGLWHCEPLPDSGAQQDTRAVFLKVYAAPGVPYLVMEQLGTEPVTAADVQESAALQVTCVSPGSAPPVEVTWLAESPGQSPVNVTSLSRTVTQLDTADLLYSTRSQLTLNVTRDLAGGRVTCVTSHHQLQVLQEVTLTINVQYAPRFSVMRYPAFGNPIIRGMRVNLTCSADANPPVTAMWVKDDEVSNKDGTLLFNPISLQDAGWYKCTAGYQGRNVSSYSFFLNVIDDVEEADASFRTVETTVGALMSLRCDELDEQQTRGSPCWIRESETGRAVASRGHRIHFDGATYADTAVYSCEMPLIGDQEMDRRAKARSFFVKVTGQPMISWLNVTGDLVLGESAALLAQFCADPAPTQLLWVLGSSAAALGQNTGELVASGLSDGGANSCYRASLQIHRLQAHMTGPATLVVTNSRGTDTRSLLISPAHNSHVTASTANHSRPPAALVAMATVLLSFVLFV